jgi:uncharacterized membrane protein YfcA
VELLISVMYVVILGGIGGFMVYNSIAKLRRGVLVPEQRLPKSAVFTNLLARLPFQAEFARSGVRHSILLPFTLCSVVGVMTAFMGVGGGFMLVPVMVYLLRMPAHVAVGTSLFQVLFTCMGATIMQSGSNHSVDVVLALVIAAGSTIGAQLGARMSRRLRGEQLLIVLGILALVVCLKMAVGIALPPLNPLSDASGHAMLRVGHNTAPALARTVLKSPLSH